MNRQDIFYAGSIKNLKEFKQEGNNLQSYRGSVMSIPRSVIGQAASSLSQAGAHVCFGFNFFDPLSNIGPIMFVTVDVFMVRMLLVDFFIQFRN